MTIYILTGMAGRDKEIITEFDNKEDFYIYCSEINASGIWPTRTMNIEELCDNIYDQGMGFGQRCHGRILKGEVLKKFFDRNAIVENHTSIDFSAGLLTVDYSGQKIVISFDERYPSNTDTYQWTTYDNDACLEDHGNGYYFKKGFDEAIEDAKKSING